MWCPERTNKIWPKLLRKANNRKNVLGRINVYTVVLYIRGPGCFCQLLHSQYTTKEVAKSTFVRFNVTLASSLRYITIYSIKAPEKIIVDLGLETLQLNNVNLLSLPIYILQK